MGTKKGEATGRRRPIKNRTHGRIQSMVCKKGIPIAPESVTLYRGGEASFHCQQAVLSPDAIQWHRSNAQDGAINLTFHPGRAEEFGIRLSRAVRMIMCR